jgi:cell division transport system permease protein
MRYSIREAFTAIRRAPLLTFLSAAMVGLALLVVGLFSIVSFNLHEALNRVEERVEIVAFVRDDARQAELIAAQEAILGMAEVRAVRFVSKEEALSLAEEQLPEFQDIFMGLEGNPLPASIEVELHPGNRDPESVARVAGVTSLYPFVEDVVYGQDWVDRLFVLRRVGAVTTTILGIAFGAVAALIIATAVRIAIFARREEIQIMRLVGATNGFIRRPFLLEGFITGLVGGIIALLLTYSAYVAGSRLIFPLEWIPARWVALGVLAGGIFGVAASALAIRRYLQEV